MKIHYTKKVITCMAVMTLLCACGTEKAIYQSEKFAWYADRITQGDFTAQALDAKHIVSNYQSPTDTAVKSHEWVAKNNFDELPRYEAPGLMETAIYNMGLDEMINAIEPDSTLRTGADWGGVWTRDVSYSIILSMAHMQPRVSMISLMHKVNSRMRIIQDTGTGGAWPCSTDRIIWVSAAWEIYLATGDREWLETIYPVICNTIEDDRLVAYDKESGLMYGETSFIDWREQSYPLWMQPADIFQSKAHGTNVIYAHALNIASTMAMIMNDKEKADRYNTWGSQLTKAINEKFRLKDVAYSPSYLYGRGCDMATHRAESLGESMGIIFDITEKERQREVLDAMPLTEFGTPVFYPFIPDMFSYHNNATWPFPACYYAIASAKVGNTERVLFSFATVYRAAAMFCTNKENYEQTSGDYKPMPMNSSNMLWSLSGNIALTHKVLFGMDFTEKGLVFEPFVPKEMAGMRKLQNFKYRNAVLDITLNGYGSEIKSMTIDGVENKERVVAADIEGNHTIIITMNNNDISGKKLKLHKDNHFAPQMPKVEQKGDKLNVICEDGVDKYIVMVDDLVVKEEDNNGQGFTIDMTDKTMKGEITVAAYSQKSGYSFKSEPIRNYAEEQIIEVIRHYTPTHNELKGYYASEYVKVEGMDQIIEIPVEVKKDGAYVIDIHYANGNGPINTENKCAIRSLDIDGEYAGAVIMPHRGTDNWVEWGWSNVIKVDLTSGHHTLKLYFRNENHNMNITTNSALIDQVRVALAR